MAWVRSGDCIRCGECCQGYDPWGVDFATRANVSETASVRPVVRQPGYCPLYDIVKIKGKDTGVCRGHEPTDPALLRAVYLRLCAAWPTSPDDIVDFPSCSYTFEWIE